MNQIQIYVILSLIWWWFLPFVTLFDNKKYLVIYSYTKKQKEEIIH